MTLADTCGDNFAANGDGEQCPIGPAGYEARPASNIGMGKHTKSAGRGMQTCGTFQKPLCIEICLPPLSAKTRPGGPGVSGYVVSVAPDEPVGCLFAGSLSVTGYGPVFSAREGICRRLRLERTSLGHLGRQVPVLDGFLQAGFARTVEMAAVFPGGPFLLLALVFSPGRHGVDFG